MLKPKIIFLVGPTAIGKTDIAIRLAKKLNAEVISCDSMQVYRGMDILTSKPLPALRKRATHHLIGLISPEKEYNAARYRRDALAKIKQIIKKKKVPLFAGGTGLYMSVLIDGIFDVKAENKTIRQALFKQAEARGSRYLYEKLKKKDPEAALKIHPNDTKRIVRALEVFEITGRPISQLQKERKGLFGKYDIMIFGLNMPRDKLYQKINERVDKMFRQGLIKEVKKLLKLRLSRTAAYAIGIREIKGYLDGCCDLEEAKRLMKRNSRLYAKRQLTWFRKDRRIEWLEIGEREKPKQIAERIWNALY